MSRLVINKRNNEIKKNIFMAIPILFLLSPLLHFTYGFTNESKLIANFVPVNESIWEHFKLGTIPMIIWWASSYFILRKRIFVDFKKWIFAASISTAAIPIVIANFYYFYTGAFGIESIILDVFSLILALIVGQSIAYHLYKNIRINNLMFYFGIFIILIIISLTILMTFYPIHVPMLRDGSTGIYGIN